MGKLALRDSPLQEITLRKYEEPIGLSKEELVRKFCLSVGLLQPGESRDIIVDIFLELLEARKERKELDVPYFVDKLGEKGGASSPNVRRQLRRLKDLKLVEKSGYGYRITEFGLVTPVVEGYIEQFVIKLATERVKKYAQELDRSF